MGRIKYVKYRVLTLDANRNILKKIIYIPCHSQECFINKTVTISLGGEIFAEPKGNSQLFASCWQIFPHFEFKTHSTLEYLLYFERIHGAISPNKIMFPF